MFTDAGTDLVAFPVTNSRSINLSGVITRYLGPILTGNATWKYFLISMNFNLISKKNVFVSYRGTAY